MIELQSNTKCGESDAKPVLGAQVVLEVCTHHRGETGTDARVFGVWRVVDHITYQTYRTDVQTSSLYR